jgi:hypothetical protein
MLGWGAFLDLGFVGVEVARVEMPVFAADMGGEDSSQCICLIGGPGDDDHVDLRQRVVWIYLLVDDGRPGAKIVGIGEVEVRPLDLFWQADNLRTSGQDIASDLLAVWV